MNAATFSSSTSLTPNLTIKTPTVTAKCNSSYFSTTVGARVDQENSGFAVAGMLYRHSLKGAAKSMYDNAVDLFVHPLT